MKLSKYRKLNQSPSKGEVFTPPELVQEMLSKLPIELFISTTTTFLIPSVREGTFIVEVVKKLMKYGHSKENALSRVIGTDQRSKYVNPLKRLGYRVYKEDLLNPSEEFEKRLNMKFDVVLGNPPYNKGQNTTGKRGGGHNLWTDFTVKSINDLLKKDGYLLFVHPTLWRKPRSEKSSSREVSELMFSKQIHYLEMHDAKDGLKTFNAGTRYDWYILENSPIYKKTKINDETRTDVEVDLRDYEFLPNFDIDLFDKIKVKGGEKSSPIIYNRSNYGSDKNKDWTSEEKTSEFKYPLVHSTPKDEIRFMYSSINSNGHFGIPKVIFGDSGINHVIIDMDGQYGMTQHSMAIEVESLEEAENIKKALMSKKFTKFLESMMWSNFQIDWRMFNYFKKDFWKEFI